MAEKNENVLPAEYSDKKVWLIMMGIVQTVSRKALPSVLLFPLIDKECQSRNQ